MAIAFANLGTSATPDFDDGSDLTSYATASWTPPASGLIFVYVWSTRIGGPSQPTMSGNNLTWTAIASLQPGSTHFRLTLFGANASGSSTGATTIDLGGQTQTNCTALFAQATGVDLSGGVAAAFVQAPTNSSAIDQTSGSVTLAAAGHADNRPIVCFGHSANEATTPRANWTELDDMNGSGNNRGVETQYRSDAFETTASATWVANEQWAGIAAELKAEAGGATIAFEVGGIPIGF